jgi:hypothetical protein
MGVRRALSLQPFLMSAQRLLRCDTLCKSFYVLVLANILAYEGFFW